MNPVTTSHPLDLLSDRDDTDSLWVFCFPHPLNDSEQATVQATVQDFLKTWNCHGAPVDGTFRLVDAQVALLCGRSTDGISGCSTDSAFRVFKQLRSLGLDALDRSRLYLQQEGRWRPWTRLDLVEAHRSGAISGDTPVLQVSLAHVGELRAQGLSKPLQSFSFLA